MEVTVATQYPPIDSDNDGWTCPYCGLWIRNGEVHICAQPPAQPYQFNFPCMGCALYQKLDALLEKLSRLLELLEKKAE